jgi:hypothetical protein
MTARDTCHPLRSCELVQAIFQCTPFDLQKVPSSSPNDTLAFLRFITNTKETPSFWKNDAYNVTISLSQRQKWKVIEELELGRKLRNTKKNFKM